jgi:hypothetical protein
MIYRPKPPKHKEKFNPDGLKKERPKYVPIELPDDVKKELPDVKIRLIIPDDIKKGEDIIEG